MRGAPHNGFAWLMFRIKSRISAGTFGLPGRRLISASNTKRRLYGAKPSLYRGERCVDSGANRATIARAKPTKPVGALEAQTRRHVLLENGELVTKREDLRLQGSAG